MSYVIAYVATAVAFLALDFVWLGTVANSFYRSQLGPLMRDPINLPAAGLFYLIYVAGLIIFAVAPALSGGSWRTALVYGALLGLVAYGTYDLTNLATVRDWPLALSIVDLSWGTAVSGVAATVGFLIARRFA